MKTTLAVSLLVTLLSSTALADTRIAILPVGGPGGAKAEAAMRKALGKRKDVAVIPAAAVKAAIKKHGRKVEALARALKADVVFVSLTSKAGKNMKLNVGVYDSEGARIGGNGWQLKGAEMKPVESTLWAELGSTINKAEKGAPAKEAPAKDEAEDTETAVASKKPVEDAPRKEAADDAFEDEKPVAKKEVVAEKKKEEVAPRRTEVAKAEERQTSRRDSADEDVRSSDEANEVTLSGPRGDREPSAFGDLEAEIGMHAFTRNFSYNQPLFGSLAAYKLTSGPAIAGAVQWYLGQLGGEGPLSNLGVGLLGESAFGIGSQAQDGSRVGTSAYAFDLGARYRIPVSKHRVVVGAGYGTRVFAVADTEDPVLTMVPDVSYKYVSARASGRFSVSDELSVNATVAYLHLLGTGELGSDRFFPRLSGAGVEAAAFIGYEVAPQWEVRVGVDMTRFFFSLKPEVGDANVAGGATDQFFAGTARVAYSL